LKKSGLFKLHAIRILLSLLLALPLLLNALDVFKLGFVARLENYAYDLRLQWTMPDTPYQNRDRPIVIVDIDEKSLLEQGHWPWPRNKLAHLVDLLFDRYKIDALGFDILFAERDESSGLKTLEQLAQGPLKGDAAYSSALGKLRPGLDYDQVLADSLKDRRVALGFYFRQDRQKAANVGSLPPPPPWQTNGAFEPSKIGAPVATGFTGNLPQLQTNSTAAGFFDLSSLQDADGVIRRVPLLQLYDGEPYETLGLALARLALREPTIKPALADGEKTALAVEGIKLGKHSVPVDDDVAALVPYRGEQGRFAYVSASDVLQENVAKESLRGAIVLVGATAAGLNDLRNTPTQQNYPGVEVHASMVAGIVDGGIKERPTSAVGIEATLLVLATVLLALALPALNPVWATVLTAVVMISLAGVNLYVWDAFDLVLPVASTLLLALVLFVFNMSYGFFIESRGKRLLSGLFGQYVPPELVDEMAKDPGAYSLAGESRELTVLFSDVRGFTTISEGLDPTQLTELMNEFLTPMTQVIHQHRGTIDKYMGDAIMAFWGAPVPDPQHARNALLAALDMIARLESLQGRFKSKGWPPIRVGVGLNSGEMTVGNMGSEFRLAYTVMGDAVNLGSRLEGLTKEYGVQIIVSEFTRAAVPDFVFRELDCVRVKGKARPVGIYEPMTQAEQSDARALEELALHEAALRAYRTQDWPLAEEEFGQLRGLNPQRYLYELYAGRIAYFREHPPGADWDGAFTFTTK
jgi:adenylate cyclase